MAHHHASSCEQLCEELDEMGARLMTVELMLSELLARSAPAPIEEPEPASVETDAVEAVEELTEAVEELTEAVEELEEVIDDAVAEGESESEEEASVEEVGGDEPDPDPDPDPDTEPRHRALPFGGR
jgi:hypothetical protein